MTCIVMHYKFIFAMKTIPTIKKNKLVGVLITTPSYLINLQSSSPVNWASAVNGDTLVHYALEFRYECSKLFVIYR